MFTSNGRRFLKQDDNYYPQVFFKKCKYIEKKVVRHIHDNVSDFSYFEQSDVEQTKVIRLMIF